MTDPEARVVSKSSNNKKPEAVSPVTRVFRLSGGRLVSRPPGAPEPVKSAPPARSATPAPEATPAAAPTADQIRRLAYEKWETAGCPTGDGAEYWLAAERELAGPA